MPPKLPDQVNRPQKGTQAAFPPTEHDRPFGLAPDQPLSGQQCGDFRGEICRGLSLRPLFSHTLPLAWS